MSCPYECLSFSICTFLIPVFFKSCEKSPCKIRTSLRLILSKMLNCLPLLSGSSRQEGLYQQYRVEVFLSYVLSAVNTVFTVYDFNTTQNTKQLLFENITHKVIIPTVIFFWFFFVLEINIAGWNHHISFDVCFELF